jgi:DNA-directed RNA polymerase subunit RPC12/RpoP
MALIKCPECGKEISDNANKCPNCGNPMYVKKKHSPLGIVSAVICGISILFPTPGYSLAVLAMLLAIIDLIRNGKTKYIIDDLVVIVIGLLNIFIFRFLIK